ncbi:FAD-binding domain-containing protein [Kordia algicida OT-1]|uniref:Putative deoxyribodipyrimidine photolyase n=1 Tax=Kordia algicida OT-1 TaxID=391587 RepID=A9E3L8_9FLAO|nr:FAD-binding domain-containing protein [Kordia algicida]EDP95233.1 putative deoxyribodipyrimidine photolyase [Kordia algicida OT-1]
MNTQNKIEINVVLFKRDLRLQDNEAIHNALSTGKKTLLLFVFEDILLNDPHYSERHWNFIKESLIDLNNSLIAYNSEILIVRSNINRTLQIIQETYKITHLFSHQETGIKVTYDRDKMLKRFLANNMITWVENINNGVFRGLQDRTDWIEKWENFMNQPLLSFLPKKDQLFTKKEVQHLASFFHVPSLETNPDTLFQKGGTTMALKYKNTFFRDRGKNYNHHISKPLLARRSCSRLSPYLAWGNLSVREVIQETTRCIEQNIYPKQMESFGSRLRWQAHFIQKFEMEDEMEFVSINKGYRKLKKRVSERYIEAWKNGMTGYPLVDACMRCLKETGYLNFRMRALVVSFFTHNLWQPWQKATVILSQYFLDFEPGIHFPQIQMQAGETGINMLRMYNPTKNGIAHDPEGIFIKKWVPELAELDTAFVHEPSKMTPMEQQMANFILGKDYPKPIVNLQETRKHASDILWNMKDENTVIEENFRILQKHTLSNRKKSS